MSSLSSCLSLAHGRFLPLVFGREIRASKHDVKRSRSPVGFEPALSRCRFLVCSEPLGYGVLHILEQGSPMFKPNRFQTPHLERSCG